MIDHIVLLQLKPTHDPVALADVMRGLEGLVDDIDGFTAFRHGPNRDYEGRSPHHAYGFVGQFHDALALAVYAQDPRHRALAERLMALCDDLMVADLDSA
ncbi:Stress responsive A/B Barrel Domain [Loktanella fryxellensis]|uniref:Stress responsive A/B Barrel Domain n=1 Tax=Loktanella fryxellensis TaxID=245187 RepID=A0A1H8IJ71_9RHOB|nr:Dabb family protein [Loktanella fryxellensis]SEN68401.1 Stress responsive A/B Barrel Domain [Loktanella fryxellensis]